jgi:hypothetical protein
MKECPIRNKCVCNDDDCFSGSVTVGEQWRKWKNCPSSACCIVCQNNNEFCISLRSIPSLKRLVMKRKLEAWMVSNK